MINPAPPRFPFSVCGCGVASVQIGFRCEVGVKFRARRHSEVAHDEGNGKCGKVTEVHRNMASHGEVCHLSRTMTRHLFRPVSHIVQRGQIYRFSVNFLRFAWFFVKVVRREERGVLSGVRWAARRGKGERKGDKVT